jgi:hypothetical protein
LQDRQNSDDSFENSPAKAEADTLLWQHYHGELDSFSQALSRYREQLDSNSARTDLAIADDRAERDTLADIDRVAGRIKKYDTSDAPDWLLDHKEVVSQLRSDVDHLRDLTVKLPSYLHDRFRDLASRGRLRY